MLYFKVISNSYSLSKTMYLQCFLGTSGGFFVDSDALGVECNLGRSEEGKTVIDVDE